MIIYRSELIDYMRFCRTIQDANASESLNTSPLHVSVPYVPSSEAYSQAFLNFKERRLMADAMYKIAKLQNQNLEEIFKVTDLFFITFIIYVDLLVDVIMNELCFFFLFISGF